MTISIWKKGMTTRQAIELIHPLLVVVWTVSLALILADGLADGRKVKQLAEVANRGVVGRVETVLAVANGQIRMGVK